MRRLAILLSASVGAVALFAINAAAAAPALTGPPTPALKNGSFEKPPLGNGVYVYSDTGATWVFGGALVNAEGASAWYGSTPPSGVDGNQFLALQGNSTLSQNFIATGSTMTLSWLSGGRPNGGSYGGDQTYTVSVGSGPPVATVATQDGSEFVTETATVTGLTKGQSYALTFSGLASSDQTAFIDRVEINGQNLLTNGGFESPNLGAGVYSYSTPPDGWTLTGALVNASGSSAWYGSQAPAGYGGDQFVALQSTSTLSQTFTSPKSSGQLEWLSGGRPDFGSYGGDQSYQVWLNNTDLGTFSTTSGQAFHEYDFGVTGLNVGSNTLTFVGLSTGDNTAFIDNVFLAAVPEPATWAMMLLGVGMIGGGLRMARRKHATSLLAA